DEKLYCAGSRDDVDGAERAGERQTIRNRTTSTAGSDAKITSGCTRDADAIGAAGKDSDWDRREIRRHPQFDGPGVRACDQHGVCSNAYGERRAQLRSERHVPLLSLVIRADERRRVKAVPTGVSRDPNGGSAVGPRRSGL